MQHAPLLPRIRRRVVELLAGYVRARELVTDVDAYIVPPALGADTGVLGALALAHTALAARRSETSTAE
jgi:fructokinase